QEAAKPGADGCAFGEEPGGDDAAEDRSEDQTTPTPGLVGEREVGSVAEVAHRPCTEDTVRMMVVSTSEFIDGFGLPFLASEDEAMGEVAVEMQVVKIGLVGEVRNLVRGEGLG